jgi:hypothetical protein
LAVFDGAPVGALGLEGELAFGVAHRVVGRPDAAVDQTPRPPCRRGALACSSRRRIFLLVSDGWAKA